eukprot:3337937-Amphidinium_carterae.3
MKIEGGHVTKREAVDGTPLLSLGLMAIGRCCTSHSQVPQPHCCVFCVAFSWCIDNLCSLRMNASLGPTWHAVLKVWSVSPEIHSLALKGLVGLCVEDETCGFDTACTEARKAIDTAYTEALMSDAASAHLRLVFQSLLTEQRGGG